MKWLAGLYFHQQYKPNTVVPTEVKSPAFGLRRLPSSHSSHVNGRYQVPWWFNGQVYMSIDISLWKCSRKYAFYNIDSVCVCIIFLGPHDIYCVCCKNFILPLVWAFSAGIACQQTSISSTSTVVSHEMRNRKKNTGTVNRKHIHRFCVCVPNRTLSSDKPVKEHGFFSQTSQFLCMVLLCNGIPLTFNFFCFARSPQKKTAHVLSKVIHAAGGAIRWFHITGMILLLRGDPSMAPPDIWHNLEPSQPPPLALPAGAGTAPSPALGQMAMATNGYSHAPNGNQTNGHQPMVAQQPVIQAHYAPNGVPSPSLGQMGCTNGQVVQAVQQGAKTFEWSWIFLEESLCDLVVGTFVWSVTKGGGLHKKNVLHLFVAKLYRIDYKIKIGATATMLENTHV